MKNPKIKIELEFVGSEINADVKSFNCSPIMLAHGCKGIIQSIQRFVNDSTIDDSPQIPEKLKGIKGIEDLVDVLKDRSSKEAFEDALDEIKTEYPTINFEYSNEKK